MSYGYLTTIALGFLILYFILNKKYITVAIFIFIYIITGGYLAIFI